MRLGALLLLLVGCATAGTPDQPSDAGNQQGDGNTMKDSSMGTTDAAVDAAGPMMRTLMQTNSPTLKAGNSLACANTTGTRANNYYRVFDLPAMGVSGAFAVTQVSFQIEHCHHNSGIGCTVAVRVGTYSGTPGTTLATANMTILASNASVTIPEVIESGTPPTTPGGTVNAPITASIPAGSKLLVEVDAPDGAGVYSFYMGSNDGGETGLGYVLGTSCAINVPTNISGAFGTTPAAQRNLLLTVTGTI